MITRSNRAGVHEERAGGNEKRGGTPEAEEKKKSQKPVTDGERRPNET
jgi:hypothetical protein